MENTRSPHSQLELFSQSAGPARKSGDIRSFFLGYVRNYEKAILLFICFLVTAIIFFSFGVERGKRLKSLPQRADVLKPPAPTPEPKPVQEIDKSGDTQKYTIQLASYEKKSYADKEARRLKKKGFTVLVMSKGNYSIVCVGKFADREMAKSLLSEFKKTYHDSFIRRL